MTYICHNTYNGITETGRHAHIERGEELPLIGNRIARDGAPVCSVASAVSHRHFARNDDGQGLRRGAFIYAIAYEPREREHSDGHVYRFSEKEISMLQEKWAHFLKQDSPILFNHEFHEAGIQELEELANELGIKIEG